MISINQLFGEWAPVNNQMIISVTYSNTNPNLISFNGFRFTIQLSSSPTFSTYVTASQIKKYADVNGVSTLDIQRVVSDYVDYDFNYTTFLWEKNPNKTKFVRIGVEEDWIDINGNQTFSAFTYSQVRRSVLSRIDLLDFIEWRDPDLSNDNIQSGWIDNDYILGYTATASNNNELSPILLDEYKVGLNDYGVVSFFQDIPFFSLSNRFPIDRLVLESYNSNDVLLDKVVKPYNYQFSGDRPRFDDKTISIFSGPSQISNINAGWRNYSATQSAGSVFLADPLDGASYYLLYVEYSELDGFTGFKNFYRNSREIKYKLTSYCNDYYRIAWLNSLSGWDFYNFDGRPDITINHTKSSYNKISDYNYQINTLGGRTNYNSKWNKTIQTNSNWISREEASLIETMFESPVVFVQVGTEFIPINIITESVKRWTDVDDLFFYQFQFTFQNSEYFRK
jgi:hypothetical protein